VKEIIKTSVRLLVPLTCAILHTAHPL